MFCPAAGCIAVNNGRWITSAPLQTRLRVCAFQLHVFASEDVWPIIARIGPKLAKLDLLAARIKDRRTRLVGKQFRRGLQDLEQSALDRREKRS